MTTHKRKRTSFFRRLISFVVMVVTGGTAGLGGWAIKDHPRVQALVGFFLGQGGEDKPNGKDPKSALATAVSDLLGRDEPRQPGVYKVRITEVKLDPRAFSNGHTVDLQARVRKIDAQGRETTLWESKSYGENLAVAGQDELTATWIHRPFEIAWSPGDQVVVDVWDRRSSLLDHRDYRLALPEPGVFPLASGTHALEVAGRNRSAPNSELNHIVFQSQRVRDSAPAGPQQLAERPILIR